MSPEVAVPPLPDSQPFWTQSFTPRVHSAAPVAFVTQKLELPIQNALDAAANGRVASEDAFTSIKNYLRLCGPEYNRKLGELLQNAAPLPAERRLSICIPVAAHQEERYITRCLDGLSHQTADPSSFEIVLLYNHPDRDSRHQPIVPDGSIEAVSNWRARHPHLNIETMYAVLPRDTARIGMIRGILSDALALRTLQRGDTGREHIMMRFDADADGAPTDYIATTLRMFDAEKPPVLMRGPLAVSPRELHDKPLLAFSSHLFYGIFDHLLESGTEIHGGPNSACTVSAYARAGGFDHSLSSGEDAELDRRIFDYALLSGNSEPMATQLPSLRVYTSARRGAAALARGLPFSSQWDDERTTFRCDDLDAGRGSGLTIANDAIRFPTKKAVDSIMNQSASDLVEYLQMSADRAPRIISKLLNQCGINVKQTGGKLAASDASQVMKWFGRYMPEATSRWNSEVLGRRL